MLQRVIGHWQESTIFTAATGSYTTVTDGIDNSLTGVTDRPNEIAPATVSNPTVSKWFNTAAFVDAPVGTFGSLGRQTILGPGSWNANVALFRTFVIRENQHVDFRAEAFNVLNHTQLSNPVTTMNSPSYGQITAAAPPRIMQFALKYVF
jgi:hypothetical protein